MREILIFFLLLIIFSSTGETYLYKITSKETTDIYVSDKVLSEEEKKKLLAEYKNFLLDNYHSTDSLRIKILHHPKKNLYVLEAEKR